VELITVSEAAKEKGISREAVYQAIRSGRIASQRVLGRIGIVRASLAHYQPNQHKVQAGRVRALRAGMNARQADSREQANQAFSQEAGNYGKNE
jgi:excisionase family DNA binding protein